jgi:hypothetical protein
VFFAALQPPFLEGEALLELLYCPASLLEDGFCGFASYGQVSLSTPSLQDLTLLGTHFSWSVKTQYLSFLSPEQENINTVQAKLAVNRKHLVSIAPPVKTTQHQQGTPPV